MVICDDCWLRPASTWTFTDQRRRCQECFPLRVAILTGTATPAQREQHSALIGVLNEEVTYGIQAG